MNFYTLGVFHFKGGWVGIPPLFRAVLVQWAELQHVDACFCSHQWFSNPLHNIHFLFGCVFFLRFQDSFLHSWFSLLGFGVCNYHLCNIGRQDSHRCCPTDHCSLFQVIVPTFWQVQGLQCYCSITFCLVCTHQTAPIEIYLL